MIKLLVIADDFTGALDTGVQFHCKGTLVRVAKTAADAFDSVGDDIQLLIIDAETRHAASTDAYRTVYSIVKKAAEMGIPHIYKKTDSGLRGNIGAELGAALVASGLKRLHFLPAFPVMGRTTVKGIHYVDGVPVSESVFGKDPFEPVITSYVPEIISASAPVEVHEMGMCSVALPDGVLIYDSETDEDLSEIAASLGQQDELHLVAGCAGLAAQLPELLKLEQVESAMPVLNKDLLVVCGSVNPITLGQLDHAEKQGTLRLKMPLCRKLERAWLTDSEGDVQIGEWLQQINMAGNAILESATNVDAETVAEYADRTGMTMEDVRLCIADVLGAVLKRMVDAGLDKVMMVTGGDTLLSFLNKMGINELVPLCECAPGVVLSRIRYAEKDYYLISKSGGFGKPELLENLQKLTAAKS